MPANSRFNPRSVLRAQTRIAGETEKKLEFVGASWILTDGNVLVPGELQFDPCSALRAQSGLLGEGRHRDHAAD
jgi:hypothetical protein